MQISGGEVKRRCRLEVVSVQKIIRKIRAIRGALKECPFSPVLQCSTWNNRAVNILRLSV